MKKYYLDGFYIIVAIISVVVIHRLSPSNLAGPGWDIVVYFAALIVGVVLFANGIRITDRKYKRPYVLFFIDALGLVLILAAIYYAMKSW